MSRYGFVKVASTVLAADEDETHEPRFSVTVVPTAG
jgi:hypothetical protein